MKKPLLISLSVIALFLLVYFGMWFFLCQLHALKVGQILNTVYPAAQSADKEAFQKAFSSADRQINREFQKHSASKFYQALTGILSSYGPDFSAEQDASSPAFKTKEILFFGELVNVALSRGMYSESSVPLGAMGKSLVRYMDFYNSNKEIFLKVKDQETLDTINNNYMEYDFLIRGKIPVLKEFFNSGDPARYAVALKIVESERLKKMIPEIRALFPKFDTLKLRLQAAETLYTLECFNDRDVNEFVMSQLRSKDQAAVTGSIYLLSLTGNTSYIPVIAALSNTRAEDVRDAVANAIIRLKNK
jgi:hypothetical protein